MSLVVGIDTYVTVEDADKYISENYTSNSSEFNKWNSLTDSDKEVLLRRSASSLNKLQYSGSKRICGQKLAFPRMGKSYSVYSEVWVPYVSQYYDNTFIKNDSRVKSDGLDLAIEAQIKNAVACCNLGDKFTSAINERRLAGIKSRSASSVSESYDNDSSDISKNIVNGIYTEEVYQILKPWLSNAYASI